MMELTSLLHKDSQSIKVIFTAAAMAKPTLILPETMCTPQFRIAVSNTLLGMLNRAIP
jgi:hypothetical protein